MLSILIFSINSAVSLDIDGDGNSELLVGTEKGLYLYRNILSEEPISTLLNSPTKHLSYDPENFRIIAVVDDPSSPIRIFRLPDLKDSSLPITGTYRKAFYSKGKFYILSDVGLLRFDGSNLEVLEEKVYDITVCGLRGEREVFAVGERGILVIGSSIERFKGGGEFIVCLGSSVLTSKGIILLKDGKYEFFKTENPDIFSVKPLNENFITLAIYMGKPYVAFGKGRILKRPINLPVMSYTRPFYLYVDGMGILISDINLYNSSSYGVFPLRMGMYRVGMGGKVMEINIENLENYNLDEIFREEGVLSVRAGREGVEISLNLSGPSNVEVFILSSTGKVVKTIYRGFLNGKSRFYWYGDTDNGENLKSGVYFVKANINGYTITRRIVWLR